MSQVYRDAVRTHSKQRGSRRAVLNILAECADDNGMASPGNQAIADEAGLSIRTVMRSLEELCQMGEIKVIQGGIGRSHPYQWQIILPVKGDNLTPISPQGKGDKVSANANVKGDNPAPLEPTKGDNLSVKGDNLTPIGGTIGGKRKNIPSKKITTSSAEDTVTPPTGGNSSDHQRMFAKVCDIVGWDVKTLDEKSKGQVAQTVGFLGKASPPYTLEDLNQFGAQVWANDWRWQKNRQRPTLTQLRQEIGKLRAKDFPAGKVYTNGKSAASTLEWGVVLDSQVPEYFQEG